MAQRLGGVLVSDTHLICEPQNLWGKVGTILHAACWWLSGRRICLPMQETQVWSLGQEDPLEKEMATHSSILAWEIPWREELGGLQSMVLQSQTRLSD